MHITDSEIARRQLPQGKHDIVLSDDEITGFALRIRNGKRSFIFQYSITSNGKRVSARMKLGDYPAMKADAARKEASRLHSKVTLGGHPAADKRTKRAEAVHTFEILIDEYLRQKATEVRPSTLVEITRYLKVHARELHRLPVATITRATVVKLLDRARVDYGRVSANRLQSTLAATFSWGMERGYAQANPCIGIKKKEEPSRERVLDNNELKAVWNALSDDNFGAVIKLLILSGCRLNEIAQMRWDEVDFSAGLIRLPASRVKTKRPHDVPMSGPIRQILAGRKRERDDVFGSDRGQMGDWEGRMRRLQKSIAERRGSPLQHFTPHDLRRSFASGCAEIDVPPHIVESILNHVSGHKGGIAGIYNKAKYQPQMREALERWGQHIVALTSRNIVPFTKSA